MSTNTPSGLPVNYAPLTGSPTADTYPAQPGIAPGSYNYVGSPPLAPFLICKGCVRMTAQVLYNVVFYQLGILSGGAIVWLNERMMNPGFFSIDRAFDAVRFRSAYAGMPANLTVDVITPSDLGGLGADG